MEQFQRVWGQKYRVYLKKGWMTTRAALGKREVERGKLSDKFCLAWAGASMYEASSENHWCCFRRTCSLSLQLMGEDWDQILREETCKGPVAREWGLICRHWRYRERKEAFNRNRVG